MMTSEEKFLTAILTQAVEDASYEGNSKKYLKHKVAATNWIVSNDPEYQNYCRMIGLDPNTIRNKLLKSGNTHITKQQNKQIERTI